MTNILGISAFYHDSAAALVVDGEIIAAAEEERFTRIKHDAGFPKHAIEYCLSAAGIEAEELDYVGFYEKPLLKFERLLETYLAFVPAGYASFRQAIPMWLKQKLHLPKTIRQGLSDRYGGRLVYLEHHQSHAASAFFPSPFDEAAILTLDGVGEWATTCFGVGRANKIELKQQIRFPHSLGLLYSAFTYYCGFRVNRGEYKLMGLAPYGEPRFKDLILRHLIDLKPDGSFHLDMSYFRYCQGLTMTSPKFHRLFGGKPRIPESEITQREMDLAASIQAVTEEVILRVAGHVHQQTGMERLVMAGGVALNCVANGRLLREGPFQDIWIQPAAGDSGGALGTALFIWYQLLNNRRTQRDTDSQQGSFLGPDFSDEQMLASLQAHRLPHHTCDSEQTLCQRIASLLAEQNVVGWFQGRMEFGPRALGNRSILADSRSKTMQSLMNLKIKFRESFRPFAPIVMQEHVANYFEMRPDQHSPYMSLVAPVQEAIRCPMPQKHQGALATEKLNDARSILPAVTHVDYSARVQTVDRKRHGRLHCLLEHFHQLTGCPVLVNTSFNVRGQPIVCTPDDAIRGFLATEMDVLVLGHRFVLKSELSTCGNPDEQRNHLAPFQLD